MFSRFFKTGKSPFSQHPLRQRLQLETLEARLVLSWTGIPPSIITPPAAPVPVTLNSQNDASSTAAITNNEVDYYSLIAPTSGSYRLAASTPSSSLDTVLGVFSSTGTRLAYNDDISTSNFDSQLSINLTVGNRYYFGITNYTRTRGGSYSWVVDGPAPDDSFEQNDSFGQAYNLGTLTATQTISGLVMADSQDWYNFTQTSTGATTDFVQISFVHSQGDLDMRLFNSSGIQIGISQGVTNSERISLNGLPAETYYMQVFGFQGVFNPSYALDILPGTGGSPPPSPPPPSPPPPPPPPTSGFHIEMTFNGLTPNQVTVFQSAATRWEEIIIGDLPDAVFNSTAVDDLLIAASATPIDGVGRVLGQAAPDAFRSASSAFSPFLPYHGFMQFDTADLANMENNGQLRDVILHEIGHILGIGTIWSNRGLLTGSGGADPRFVGAQATAAYNAIFGRSETGVPVENTGGAGTRNSHWRESVFGTELMTGFVSPAGTANPLSLVTVASLADLGYTVNLSAADSFGPAGAAALASITRGSTGSPPNLSAAGLVETCATNDQGWRNAVNGVFGSQRPGESAFWAAHSGQQSLANDSRLCDHGSVDLGNSGIRDPLAPRGLEWNL